MDLKGDLGAEGLRSQPLQKVLLGDHMPGRRDSWCRNRKASPFFEEQTNNEWWVRRGCGVV